MANLHVIKNAETGEVSSVPFTTEEEVEAAAMAAKHASAQSAKAAIESSKAEVKTDTFIKAFKDMTPAQVLTHVGKISNLAEAKELLAKFGMILLVVAKDQLD